MGAAACFSLPRSVLRVTPLIIRVDLRVSAANHSGLFIGK
jgi:hypothetical protein